MIVLTGATGGLGSEVLYDLLKLTPASNLAVATRHAERATSYRDCGIDIRSADFDHPESLVPAFVGADELLIVSASGIDHERRVTQHRNAIVAAVQAGVGHVFYTSLIHSVPSAAHVMQAHIDTESLLRDSGRPFTILRNGIYFEALPNYLGNLSTSEVVIPADGPVSWTSRMDLAAGIALLLRHNDHQSKTVALTGHESLSLHQVAAILSDRLDTPLTVRCVSLDEYVDHQKQQGHPEEWARHWASTFVAMEQGELAVTDPLLGAVLDRPLRSIHEFLRGDQTLWRTIGLSQ